jgi:ribosome maturation factor RimP
MSTDTAIETVENLIQPLLQEDVFLVYIKIKPTNNFKIYIDADGGLPLEKCIKINRALYKQMEEMGLYPDGDFSLEVSSPGIDEPLKLIRQYIKNVGRFIEVVKLDETRLEGKLLEANEEKISIEITEGKGKKMTINQLEVSISDIKQTKVQVKF